MSDANLTLRDVMERTGVNPITLRSWIRRAIVPHGAGRARGTRYTEDHVLRIRAVQALRAKGFGLEQVAHRVRLMSETDLAAFAQNPGASSAADGHNGSQVAPVVGTPAPASPGSSSLYPYRPLQWVPLIPGLTLLVDPLCGDLVGRLAKEIVERYAVSANAATPPG
jgi:DNA-binding transcriptional MerR regulator